MQGDLFPPAPESVLALIRRLEARVLTVGPELSANDCIGLMGELYLLDSSMNRISDRIRKGTDWQRRQQIDALSARPTRAPEPVPVPQPWRSRKLPITYVPLIAKRGEEPPVPAPEGWYMRGSAYRSKGMGRAHFHAGHSRSICGKAFVPSLVPEQLRTEPPVGAIPCADCARKAEQRAERLALVGGAR